MAPARLIRTPLALLVVGLVVALVTGMSTVPAQAAARLASFRYFTLNVQYSMNNAQAAADMNRAMTLGEVGGFQEMSDAEDRDTLAQLAPAHDYGLYMPSNGGGGAIPIVWSNARFALVSASSTKVHDAVILPAPTAANPNATRYASPPRFINTVLLTDRATGKLVAFINTHTISQASRDAQASDPDLVPYLRLHFAMLRQTIQAMAAQTDAVVAGGDFNVNFLADQRRRVVGFPSTTLGDLVTFNMPRTGSRGPTSLLDYNLSLKYGSLDPFGATIVRGFNSDHDSVVVGYGEINYFGAQRIQNVPADPAGRGYVLDRMLRALNNAPAGALVTVRSKRMGNPALWQAMNQAAARGVDVRALHMRMRGTTMTVSNVEYNRAITMHTDRIATWALVNRPTTLGISTNARNYRKNVRAFMKVYNRRHR